MFGPGGGPGGLPFNLGFNPGQTSPLDPSDPRTQMPPQFANIPPMPEPQFGGFPPNGGGGMLTNNLSAFGSPNYVGAPLRAAPGLLEYLLMMLGQQR